MHELLLCVQYCSEGERGLKKRCLEREREREREGERLPFAAGEQFDD